MKRSSHVLLVLMGVTGATAVGHYLDQRRECVQQAPAAKPGIPQQKAQQAVPQTTQPCGRNTFTTRTGSRGWWWGSSNSRDYASTSTSERTRTASSSTTSGSGIFRGGFGSTGRGFFSGS